jgi:hypothetical protein
VRGRLVLVLAVIGVALLVWGGIEWRLGRGASSTPERISLAKLIARGPEGNPNIILTDFELGEHIVYLSKSGSWTGVYVPAIPAGQGKAGPGEPAASIKAVIFSRNVHSQPEIGPMLGKHELPALVTNRIRSLDSEEANLLRQSYGANIDVDHCLIIQEGRTPMSGALLALIIGGGVLLLLGAVGVAVAGIMDDWRRTGPQRKTRRDDDRPRRRRRDDVPRPKRRRRDEDYV